MNSSIIRGVLAHARHAPVKHRFKYPVYFYCFDLDELPALDYRLPLFGYNRLRPVSLFEDRYMDEGIAGLRDKLFRYVKGAGCETKIHRVMLITSPSYFNFVFNPVSFYHCLAADGSPVCTVVEVNNTFGERHLYLLSKRDDGKTGFPVSYSAPKAFHVSPFNNMDGSYRFHFSDPAGEMQIQIRLSRQGEDIFTAAIRGERIPLTTKNQLITLLRYPATPWKTVPRILGQALRLFAVKKLPFFDNPPPTSAMTIRRRAPSRLEKFCRKQVEGLLENVSRGELTVTFPNGEKREYGKREDALRADLVITDHRFFPRVILGSDIGFGEGFMEGIWESSNPANLMRILVRNMDTAMDSELPIARLAHAFGRLLDKARHNTLSGSRRNIQRHYDLSNDFFALFLDDSMTYSSAIHKAPDESLETAQMNKLHHLIKKGHISEKDHVLEIGFGWGAFAIEAVRRTGCRVTGLTLSKAQHTFAQERVKQAGLEDRITLLLKDYRKMTGTFTKIVSIEMLEAVGHKYLGSFFRQCDRLLAPDGLVVLQVITVPDQQYNGYKGHEDWIQRHIFPGGHLPSVSALCGAMTSHSRLIVDQLENIGPHYAETLKIWRERFTENASKLPGLGFDEVFRKKWLFYLACSEAQFAERALGNIQLVLTRPLNTQMGLKTSGMGS